jgi:hypothetical protein
MLALRELVACDQYSLFVNLDWFSVKVTLRFSAYQWKRFISFAIAVMTSGRLVFTQM